MLYIAQFSCLFLCRVLALPVVFKLLFLSVLEELSSVRKLTSINAQHGTG